MVLPGARGPSWGGKARVQGPAAAQQRYGVYGVPSIPMAVAHICSQLCQGHMQKEWAAHA